MFRISCDPSSGSTEMCLTEITVVCAYGTAVPYVHTHTTGSKLRCQTPTKHTTKYLRTTTRNFSQAQLCTP